MANWMKIVIVVGSLLGVSFLFQNCVVQEDEKGQVQTKQSFPQTFDRITLGTGFSDDITEQSSIMEIDLIDSTVSVGTRKLSDDSMCDQQIDISDEINNNLMAKIKTAKLCATFLKEQPGTVCTMEVRENDYLKIFSEEKTQLNATLYGKTCGRTGAIDEMCEGGPELLTYLKSLRAEISSACN